MKIFLTLFLFIILSLSFWTNLEQKAEYINDETFNRAIYTFALSKGLNAIISVLQSSEVNVSFFVGATVGLGQILDPINDLVERFSWVMLASSVSVKIQQLLLILSKSSVMKVLLGITMSIVLVTMWIKKLYSSKVFSLSLKTFLIVAVLQFITPVFILVTQFMYDKIYIQEYSASNDYIQVYKTDLESVKKDDNNLDGFLKKYEDKAETFTKKIINLITIFIVTTILFPFLSILSLYYLIKVIFHIKIDYDIIEAKKINSQD